MKYRINWEGSDGVFAVPDLAADCLKLANGKSVKVLLYILKNKISDVDFGAVGEAVGVTEEDVEDALSYWQQVGVLYADGTTPVAVAVKEKNIMPEPVAEEAVTISNHRAKEKATKMISPAEISERMEQSEEIRFLFSAAEVTLGKVLTYTEQRTIVWLHDYYGMAPDLLLMIMDFAKSQNKASIGFIEKIASSWHDNGITTHEQAEREIRQLQNYYSLSGQITARLELNRTLTPTERKFVNEWATKGINIDLIIYAYEKTIDSIGKVKFSYMNTILLDWHGKGCANVKDVKAAENEHSSSKKTAQTTVPSANNSHSYNLDLLVAHAMNNTPKIKK